MDTNAGGPCDVICARIRGVAVDRNRDFGTFVMLTRRRRVHVEAKVYRFLHSEIVMRRTKSAMGRAKSRRCSASTCPKHQFAGKRRTTLRTTPSRGRVVVMHCSSILRQSIFTLSLLGPLPRVPREKERHLHACGSGLGRSAARKNR